MNNRILILDSDTDVQKRLGEILSKNGFEPCFASLPGQAFDSIVRHNPSLIIAEMHFDGWEPERLFQVMRKINIDLVIIIFTVSKEKRQGANRRLDRIFEFIEKPSSPVEIIGHIKRGLSFAKRKMDLKAYVTQSRNMLHKQLEWTLWSEQKSLNENIAYSRSILDSIKHHLTQGEGIGTLITLVEMMHLYKRKNESADGYTIPSDIMDMTLQSSDVSRKWINEIDTLTERMNRKYETEFFGIKELERIVRDTIAEAEPMRIIRDHTIQHFPPGFDLRLQGNTEALKMTIRELLTNAFKFSPSGSNIEFFYHRSGNSLSIMISNAILLMEGGITGIPFEYERKIFEPFFRLNNFVDERYRTEMIGMGTGLTTVLSAILQNGCRLYVYETSDPTRDTERGRIVAELILPVYDETAASIEGAA